VFQESISIGRPQFMVLHRMVEGAFLWKMIPMVLFMCDVRFLEFGCREISNVLNGKTAPPWRSKDLCHRIY